MVLYRSLLIQYLTLTGREDLNKSGERCRLEPSMQDDSLPSVFSLSLTYKVILQEVNLSPGDKALLWLPSGLQHFLLLAAGSWGNFTFWGSMASTV